MSKIESGKAILKKKAFDFAAFTRNLAAMFYGQAEKKQVRFQVLLGRSLAEAYVGDELKLNQILINLLGNAIKFTEPGGSVCFRYRRINAQTRHRNSLYRHGYRYRHGKVFPQENIRAV